MITTNKKYVTRYTYVFYSDSGHGWLSVPKKELIALGIADKVTACSYQSPAGHVVYLEEDCDMTLFVKAMEAVGKSVTIKESYVDGYSRIRKYDSYKGRVHDN